ncbi:MAG: MarR family transcriptional regulator [Dechloromonas sp.]|nr:MarR family transcriptional regulator [Dechloromonas sp.]
MSQTSLLLERLGALIQQSVRDAAARHGLLPIHIQVLHYLMRANRYSDLPIAIAEYFGITRGTVSQTLAVLERKGLLTKEPDAHHGKRLHLRLTPAGESVLGESWVERVEQALCERSIEAAALESTLRHLLSAMQRVNGQRAFGLCRQCDHFLTDENGTRCGLTHEPLATEQTVRICREWTAATSECVRFMPNPD